MKKKISLFGLVLLLLTAVLCLASCSQWEPPYSSLGDEGYNISVRYDANGGIMKGRDGVSIVEVFSKDNATKLSDGSLGIYLLDPADEENRQDGKIAVSKTGYFLAGWYTEKTPRVNEKGEALDDYGELTSVSGREQGYIYSGRWDFEKDALAIDANKEYTAQEPVMTLYAAWIPFFEYEFLAQNGDGSFTSIATSDLMDLKLPSWSVSSGKLAMGNFPEIEGKTFDTAYFDEAMTDEITEDISSDDFIDYEKGIATSTKIKIYTTWREGNWYKIYNARQFTTNSALDGNYIICNDLNFESVKWADTLALGTFRGTIVGEEEGRVYKFSNIYASQGEVMNGTAGLFGALGADAVISNISFENVTYTITGTGFLKGTETMSIGMLAGSAEDGVSLENVTVGGTFHIDAGFVPMNANKYTVEFIFADGSEVSGVVSTGVACTYDEGCPVTAEVDAQSGTVTLSTVS